MNNRKVYARQGFFIDLVFQVCTDCSASTDVSGCLCFEISVKSRKST